MPRIPNSECKTCGKAIYVRPKYMETRGFCSRKCYGKSLHTDRKCIVCGVPLHGRKLYSKTCSRACSNTSRTGIKYDGKQSNNRAARISVLRGLLVNSRGNSCQKCGYNLYPILQIHHIIEVSNGGSDDEENLQLLCPNCHATEHYLRKVKPIGDGSDLENRRGLRDP